MKHREPPSPTKRDFLLPRHNPVAILTEPTPLGFCAYRAGRWSYKTKKIGIGLTKEFAINDLLRKEDE